MDLLRRYHHQEPIQGLSMRLDSAQAALPIFSVTSWVTIRDCYIELAHPEAQLVSALAETHRLLIENCQIIRNAKASKPVIEVEAGGDLGGNLSAIVIRDCDIKGGNEATAPSVRIHTRGAGSPHCELNRVYFSRQPGGCIDLAGLSQCLITNCNRSDLNITPTAPGIIVRPVVGGVWGSYDVDRCFFTGGTAEYPDLVVEDIGPGALPVGVHSSRLQVVDMRGAQVDWNRGQNHISQETP